MVAFITPRHPPSERAHRQQRVRPPPRRRSVEPELWAREEFTRGILNGITEGVIITDERGVVESYNPAAERMFGYAPHEIIGRNLILLTVDADADQHDWRLRGDLGVREVVARRKDGSTFPMELTESEISVGGRRLFVGGMRDVTDRKNAQDELRQAYKMEAVGQITGGLVHDFNNLLGVILGNLELASSGEPTEVDKRLRAAIAAAERGAALSHRLLAFSRKKAPALVPVRLDAAVASISELVSRTLGETIDVRTESTPDLWFCQADPHGVENALLNLALNARDAMPCGGALTIATGNRTIDRREIDSLAAAAAIETAPLPYVVLAVSDTGSGMTPEVVERCFVPFSTTKDSARGSGLGLSMVHGFVQQSGGHLRVRSTVGQGTTIELYLPRSTNFVDKQEQSTVAPPATPRGRGETVLVVEDHTSLRELAVSVITYLGYRALAAGDAQSALELLRHRPDITILFTDIVLPGGMDGQELADKAQRTHPDLKVLYTTGYAEGAQGSARVRMDAPMPLQKPYHKDDLARRFRALLE